MRPLLMIMAILVNSVAFGATLEDLPKLKPGLWEIRNTTAEGQSAPGGALICIDATTDLEPTRFALAMTSRFCSKRAVTFSESLATIDAVCLSGNSQQTSLFVTIRYSGDSAYRSETRAHYDPPLLGKSESTTNQEAKWTGPCPANMKPAR